jgi:hypothetical protein
LFLGLACIFSTLYIEFAALSRKNEFIPISLGSKQDVAYKADATAIHIAGVRLQVIADAIQDQDSNADVAARFAAVQANLLTPVAWLSSPPPTRTSTPTRILPTVTPSPIPDPWILIGQARVGCNSDVVFNPVNAVRIKFKMLAGGSNDGHISFNCCGSNGAWWLVDNVWQPVLNPSAALNIGETLETSDLAGGTVTRAHFNIGCNDNEQMDIQIFYLPSPSRTLAPTNTAAASPTANRTLAPQSATLAPTQTPTPTR